MQDSVQSLNIGAWYRTPGEQPFEVVAMDVEQEVIEIQYFDGNVGEFDFETWDDLSPWTVAAPEDASGAMDMEHVDYDLHTDVAIPLTQNPMQVVDSG